MAEPRKRYALVTGCTPGGIGHYLALEFAAKGFHVLATVRNPSKYTPANPLITYLALELPHDESILSLRDRVTEITGGTLDVLYNNAGRNYVVPALDLDMHEVQSMFDANVFSVMKMCKTFAPMLIEAKGTIVQTGSLAGVMPYAFASSYAASKAALHAYSDTLRVELAPLGVRVITIVTGGVKSNIARTHRELPPASYYTPVADQYEKRLTLSQQLGVDTQQYAKRCVRHVIAGDSWYGAVSKRWVWEGKMSWIVWFAWSWLPKAVLDWYFTWKYELGRLRGAVLPVKKRV